VSMNKPVGSRWVNIVKQSKGENKAWRDEGFSWKCGAHLQCWTTHHKPGSPILPLHCLVTGAFYLRLKKLKHTEHDFMPVAAGNFVSTVEHFALPLDATGWSHITMMQHTSSDTQYMKCMWNSQVKKKMSRMSMFIY
jgi:hypothetical protein